VSVLVYVSFVSVSIHQCNKSKDRLRKNEIQNKLIIRQYIKNFYLVPECEIVGIMRVYFLCMI